MDPLGCQSVKLIPNVGGWVTFRNMIEFHFVLDDSHVVLQPL